MKSSAVFESGGPGRARTSNQTVMSRQVVKCILAIIS
jgi:hypothetical protein